MGKALVIISEKINAITERTIPREQQYQNSEQYQTNNQNQHHQTNNQNLRQYYPANRQSQRINMIQYQNIQQKEIKQTSTEQDNHYHFEYSGIHRNHKDGNFWENIATHVVTVIIGVISADGQRLDTTTKQHG